MLRFCFNILGKITKAEDGEHVMFEEKANENKTWQFQYYNSWNNNNK